MIKISIKVISSVLVLSLSASGCYSTTVIPKVGLNDVSLRAENQDTSFTVLKQNGDRIKNLQSVRAEKDTLIGQKVPGNQGQSLREVTVPIDDVKQVEKREFSRGKTWIWGIVGGVIAIGAIGFAIFSSSFSNHCDSNGCSGG